MNGNDQGAAIVAETGVIGVAASKLARATHQDAPGRAIGDRDDPRVDPICFTYEDSSLMAAAATAPPRGLLTRGEHAGRGASHSQAGPASGAPREA